MPTERKKLLLRLDPSVHDALARWAGDELRSTNAQIEFLLRRALGEAGRLPGNVGRIRRPGRPRSTDGPEPGAVTGPGEPVGHTERTAITENAENAEHRATPAHPDHEEP